MALYRLESYRTEHVLRQGVVLPARILVPMPPPKHVPFWEGPAPEEGTPRISRELRGARARRTRGRKGAEYAPALEEHPPDEPAEFRLPAKNIAEIRDLAPGSTVVRGGSARPVIKVDVHILRIFWIRGVFWVGLGWYGFISSPRIQKK